MTPAPSNRPRLGDIQRPPTGETAVRLQLAPEGRL